VRAIFARDEKTRENRTRCWALGKPHHGTALAED